MPAERLISLSVFEWSVCAAGARAVSLPREYDTESFRDALARGVPARVPGCVHHALVDSGLIEPPDRGDAELRLQWVGRAAWEYRCRFSCSAGQLAAGEHDHLDLVIDGLDTVCTLELNGVPIGDAASFHFPHRFDVRSALRAGANELAIRFAPPLAHIRAEEARLGPRPYNGDQAKEGMGPWEPFVFARKAACNFGWDWGPRVATVGIAGGVTVERWRGARVAHVRPLVVRADAQRAEVRVHVDAVVGPRHAAPLRAVVALHDPRGGVVARGECELRTDAQRGGATGIVELAIDSPRLWWPRGYGPQGADDERPRYGVRVLLRDDGTHLDEWHGRIGLRTVELDTSRDAWGSAMTLRVNGQSVFCMGANWIPEGLYAGYAEEATIRRRVRDAAEMSANMLRVWGGGVYEPACFYDECDKRGVMVWQDFMFACGMYPEEPPYRKLVEREARHQVARLSAHPSVVLWCGGNETIWGHDAWGWRERLKPGQTWGSGFWLELLPRVCAEVDPTRPYWPNSPWSGFDERGAQRDVLDADHGDRHTWEVDAWKHGFGAPKASGVPRFCSEFGQQSPSCSQTLREQGVIGQTPSGTDPKASGTIGELARRQRGPGGDARWYGSCGLGLPPEGEGFAAWLERAQAFQAAAVARGIEWHRANRPRCGGVLFWQFNDCWAGHSWSAVDAAGRRKPLWESARRAMSARVLSIHEVGGAPWLFAINDTDEPWEGEVVAQRAGPSGEVLASWRALVRIGPRCAGPIADLRLCLGEADPRVESVNAWSVDGALGQAVWKQKS
jgi:beta-mannosidase